MTAAASEFPPSLQRVTGTQGPGRGGQHVSQTDILVQQHPATRAGTELQPEKLEQGREPNERE